jgi:hypothetical protein
MHFQNDNTAKAFLRGVLLTWVPFLLFMIPMLANAFRGISNTKATGLAALAGGVAEGLATFGLAAIFITQIVAIFVLARTFNREHVLRSLFSGLSIICNLLLISFMVLSVWFIRRFIR